MGMLPPKLGKEILNKFNTIRREMSRTIIVHSQTEKVDCPNCLSDYTGASIGEFDSSFVTPVYLFDTLVSPISFTMGRCPVCEAKGYLEGSAKTGIKVLVRWNPVGEDARGDLQNTPAGMEGMNIVQVKADKCYYELLRDCEKVIVDGVTCELLKPPIYRSIGEIEVSVIVYLVAVEIGHNIRS
jgi:hypothetical protein